MLPRIKKDLFEVISTHTDAGGNWDVDFLAKLSSEYGITNKQSPALMQHYNALKNTRAVLGSATPADPFCIADKDKDVSELSLLKTTPTSDLRSYQLHPPDLHGNPSAHFSHLVQKQKRCTTGVESAAYLDLEITNDQFVMLNLAPSDFAIGSMLKEASSGLLFRKTAQRKINILGEQTGACCVSNDPKRLLALTQSLNLSSAIESMRFAKRSAQEAKLDDPESAKAKKAKANLTKKLEFPVWRALSDAGAMLCSSRAAQYKSPQMKELQKYIEIKLLDLPRPGLVNRKSLFAIVLEHVNSQPGGALAGQIEAVPLGSDSGEEFDVDDSDDDMVGE